MSEDLDKLKKKLEQSEEEIEDLEDDLDNEKKKRRDAEAANTELSSQLSKMEKDVAVAKKPNPQQKVCSLSPVIMLILLGGHYVSSQKFSMRSLLITINKVITQGFPTSWMILSVSWLKLMVTLASAKNFGILTQ